MLDQHLVCVCVCTVYTASISWKLWSASMAQEDRHGTVRENAALGDIRALPLYGTGDQVRVGGDGGVGGMLHTLVILMCIVHAWARGCFLEANGYPQSKWLAEVMVLEASWRSEEFSSTCRSP